MELRTMHVLQVLAVATSINHGAAKKQHALQVLAVAMIINHGAAKNWMRYVSSLSLQSSILELQLLDFFTPVQAPPPDTGLMFIATFSTCKAFSFSELHD